MTDPADDPEVIRKLRSDVDQVATTVRRAVMDTLSSLVYVPAGRGPNFEAHLTCAIRDAVALELSILLCRKAYGDRGDTEALSVALTREIAHGSRRLTDAIEDGPGRVCYRCARPVLARDAIIESATRALCKTCAQALEGAGEPA